MKSALNVLLLLGPSLLVSCGGDRAPAPADGVGAASSSSGQHESGNSTEGASTLAPVSPETTTGTPGVTLPSDTETTNSSDEQTSDAAHDMSDGADTSSVSPGSDVPSSEQTDDVSVSDFDASAGTSDAGSSGSTQTLGEDTTEANSSASGETDPTASATDATTSDAEDCAITQPSGSPIGYGAATTGGGNSTPIVVNSFAEAEAALAAYQDAFQDGTQSALVIRYTGRFDFSTVTDVCRQHTLDSQVLQIKEMENVTFEGEPGSSANFGIKINRAKNVIVRNMTMGLLPGGGDSDAITIEGNGTNGDVEHVWIDHNELFSSTKDDCDGAGDTEFDGLIDIKKGARYITISYNYIHDHQKTGLLGHSDSDDMQRYVTFHHNWYENVVSRTPLHRFGYVHIFNNYYNEIASSGINVRMGGVALIEANYFENAANPVTSRYSDEVGYWELRDNHVGPGITWTTESDTLANAEDWQSTTTFPSNELNYSYTSNESRCVKPVVMATAGARLTL